MKKTSPSLSSKAGNLGSAPFLYLTTRGRKTGRPREIEIWFTEQQGLFYLIAEHQTSHWVQNLRAHAEVRVRLGSESFAARAHVLHPDKDSGLCREVQELSRRKYGWGNGLVVQLTPKGCVQADGE